MNFLHQGFRKLDIQTHTDIDRQTRPKIDTTPLCGWSITRSSATAEIARVGGRYAVQGHSRSLILVQMESWYAISY